MPSPSQFRLTEFIFFILTALSSGNTFGQSHSDTLAMANAMISEKKIGHAADLLDSYCKKHPEDFNGLWLYAQTEYWLKKFRHSRELYEEAMQSQPTNAYLQLDYSRMLINTAHYHTAQKLLLKLKTFEVTRDAAMYELAKSFLWQKNNVRAKHEAEDLITLKSTDETKKILHDISLVTAPWIKLSTSFTSDTQPLQTLLTSIETGVSFHRFFSPYIGYYRSDFFYGGTAVSAPWLVMGNQLSFGRGPEIKIEVGIVQFPFRQTQEFTSKIYLRQKLGKHVVFDFQGEHRPYFNTLKSIDTVITVNHFASSIELNIPDGALGKIAFDENHFTDGNDVYSFYGYFLPKPIKISNTQLRLGYSFTFNDSKENRFVPRDSFSSILANGLPISGIYEPYFTPQQQVINSVVTSLLIPFSKQIKMGVNSNIAFYATTFNPYFYLEEKVPNTYVLYKDYSTVQYTPWDISTYIQWQPSPRWTLRADYQHKSTFFFQSNYAGLSINTVLFHEQR